MYLIDPSKDLLDIILVIIQIFTLIALLIYVKKTWDMAVATENSAKTSEKTLKEMKESRDDENAPYIVCYFELEDHTIHFVVENVGKGLAQNIKMEFTPKLRCSGYDINDISMIKDGIPYMPPNYKIKTFFDTSPRYLSSELPLHYDAKISYYGGITGKKRITKYTLDLNYIKGIHFLSRNKMHDLVKEVKEIRKVQEKIKGKL